GFDERMLTGEDVDLVWRVVDAGRQVRYAPEIVVAHERRVHLIDRLQREYDYGLSAGPLAARHPRRLHPLLASPWAAATVVVAAVPLPRPVRGAIMALVCAAATRRLAAGTGLGRVDAAALVARSVATTAGALARAVRMLWWPACLVGVRHRGPRRLLLAALLTAGSGERVARDIAHGLGVWRSVIDSRSTDPLTPRLLWRHRDTATAPYAAGS
ncbi:MAG: mycofactocin system glycosyltransferase, partial [Ilumatobacteraceae bacterium]